MFADPMHVHDVPSDTLFAVKSGDVDQVRLRDVSPGKTERVAEGVVLTLSHQTSGKAPNQVLRSLIRIDREVVVGSETYTCSSYSVTVRPLAVPVLDAAHVTRAVAAQILNVGELSKDFATIGNSTDESLTMLDLERFLVGEP